MNLGYYLMRNHNLKIILLGIIKLSSITFFAAFPLQKWFLPFLGYFTSNPVSNPWDYFLTLGELKAFPYGSVMLYVFSLGQYLVWPLKQAFGFSVHLGLLGFGIVFLVCDWVIYKILVKWFPEESKKIFYLYFCSPLVFYITYFHGQLDIIPVALVMLSLDQLRSRKNILSAIFLGLAISTKFSSFMVLPFVFLYIYKKELKTSFVFLGVCLLTYLLFLLPYGFSDGYQALVFGASEQKTIFDLMVPYVSQNLFLYITPVLLGALFIHFASYGKISLDTFFMFLGLGFMILVSFVSPMPGWYLWSYPFILYAFLRYADFPRFPLIALTASYFVYFIFSSKSTLFESLSLVFPHFSGILFHDFVFGSFSHEVIVDSILFTPLFSSMIYLMILMYVLGVKSNHLKNFRKTPYLIGIGGDSGSGKHTLARNLASFIGEQRCLQINGDANHKWERGHPMWSVMTHLDPKANHLFLQFKETSLLKKGRSIERVEYNHDSGKFMSPQVIKPDHFVLFVGLHPFFIPQMRNLFDLKIYMNTDENLRKKWKIKRDSEKRGYTEEKVLEQINNRMSDSEKYIQSQARFADLLIGYRENEGEMQIIYTLPMKWNLEPLLNYFGSISHECMQHEYDVSNEEQTLILSHKIPADLLSAYLKQNFSDFEDLISYNHQFSDDLNGFTLFLILFLLEQKQSLHHEN